MNQILNRIANEPFRLFFPLGTLCAFIGVLFWPIKIFEWGLFENTSGRYHSYMQIFGFMLAFVIGFITTAFPKLTKTKTLNYFELSILVFDYSLLLWAVSLENFFLVHLFFALTLVTLLLILGRRFLSRDRNPPETFVFLPIALICALTGSFINVGIATGTLNSLPSILELGNHLIFQGFILFLLLGIGGFLIRSILGWANKLPESKGDKLSVPPYNIRRVFFHITIALGIFASFFIESFLSEGFGTFLRAILVTIEVFGQIKIHKISKSGKLTAYSLQIALWLLVSGCWAIAIVPKEYYVDVLHLAFAGGFALATISVATRVILSHCGYSHLLQKAYLPFTIAITFLIIGLVSRILSVLVVDSYFNHLAYAGLFWGIGLIIWTVFVLSRCVKNTICFSSKKQ